MKLDRFTLTRFKKFLDYTIDFQPGLNVVKGPNESGKSTLLEALLAALYFNPNQKMDQYRNWHDSRKSRLELAFQAEGNKFVLRKDFQEQKGELERQGEGSSPVKKITTPKALKKASSQFLGLDSETAFLATACIRQDELAAVSAGRTPFQLERIIMGSDIDVSDIIRKLDRVINEEEKGLNRPAKTDGLLAAKKKEIVVLEKKYNEIRNALGSREKIELELSRLKQEIDGVGDKREVKQALLDKATLCRDLLNEQKALAVLHTEKYQRRQAVQKLVEEKERLDKDLSRSGIFRDRQAADSVMSELLKIEGRQEGTRPLVRWGQIGIALIAGLSLSFYRQWLLAAAAFVLAGVVFFLTKSKGKGDNRLKELLAGAGCRSLAEFKSIFAKYQEQYAEREAVINQLKGKLGNKNPADLSAEEADVARQLAVIDEKLSADVKEAQLGQEEFIRLRKELQEVNSRWETFTDQKKEYEINLNNCLYTNLDLVDAEERCEALQAETARIEMRHRALVLAREKMAQARQRVLESMTEEFNSQLAGYFSLFTKGRYNKIRTDFSQGGLGFQIFSPEKDEWVAPEELSNGTQDQLYLAARINLLRQVVGADTCRPPLVFDDPFMSFDPERFRQAMAVCRQISRDYQIILFTCSNQYDDYADNVIQLNETVSV